MAENLRVTGADQLRTFGKLCRQYGSKELRIELIKQVQREMRDSDIRELVAESALETLPNSGGHTRGARPRGKTKDGAKRVLRRRSRRRRTTLAGLAAQTRVVVKVITGGKGAGVIIRGRKGGLDLNALNRGKARHPTFGHDPWVLQDVPPGFFDAAMGARAGSRFSLRRRKTAADRLRAAILATINVFIQKAIRAGSGSSRAA